MIAKKTKIQSLNELDGHENLVYIDDFSAGLRGFIAIHRLPNGMPAFGATRLFAYKNETDALRDSLRLSRLMSYKSAMAGLKYGGAKAALVIPQTLDEKSRVKMFDSYAGHVNRLKGRFVTGADVGVTVQDVRRMKKRSPYFVGVNSNPVRFTSLGIYLGIISAVKSFFGTEDLSKRSIAIQGIGKVGSGLLDLVAGKMYEVFVTDIKRDILVKAKKKFPKIKVVSPGEIFSLKVDVFSPNALSHALSYANLPKFRCSIVAGAANNQLEDDAIGQILHKQGILYAPDYVINSGGLISVVDEYENDRHSAPRIESKLNNMKETLSEIFKESQRSGKPTNIVANAMAEKIFNKR